MQRNLEKVAEEVKNISGGAISHDLMLEIGRNGFRMNADMLKFAEVGEIAAVRDIIDRIAARKKAAGMTKTQ